MELDTARRQRWLSALAACAELRDDPAARESAARWTLDMAALAHADTLDSMRRAPAGLAADRYDPMPDAAIVEPRRPVTWESALRRARETGAHPWLLASVLVRWAYALVLDRPAARVDPVIAPAVDAAVEVMHALPEPSVDLYLRLVRAGLADLGASGSQMSRLVPPRVVPPGGPEAPAEVAPPAGTAQLTAEDGGGAGTYAPGASAEPTPPAATPERSGTAPAARGGATAVTGGATRADAPPSSGSERP